MKTIFSNLIIPFIAFFPLTFVPVYSAESPFSLEGSVPDHLFINNRILAKVNGKTISVVDVMKKMDITFYKQYPQYMNSTPARCQYYEISWKRVLNDLVDKELIMADAQENNMQLSDGDVRQEMEKMFGPNIIFNLDTIGLTYEEAWQMVKEELIIQRMLYFRANMLALKKVTPQNIKQAYEAYAQENRTPEQWEYQIISIRSPDKFQGQEAANLAYKLLVEEKMAMEAIPKAIEERLPSEGKIKVTLSDVYRHGKAELSPIYKDTLASLTKSSYSQPIAQKNREGRGTVYRIFNLREEIPEKTPQLQEVEALLKSKLLDVAIDQETVAYLERLRNYYHVQDHLNLISENFEPFILR